MRKIRLGRTNIEVSEVGFGALPIQRIPLEKARDLLLLAYESGVNFFDTANAYTDSELKIGKSLSHVRDKIVIATKSTTEDVETVRKHLENSLRTLNTDYIDIFQLHNPKKLPDEEMQEFLLRAKESGKIRFIGFTNHSALLANKALDLNFFDTLQFPFSLLAGEKEVELVKRAEREDVGFIAMKAMAGGLITDPEATYTYISQFPNVLPIYGVQRREELCEFLGYAAAPPEYNDDMKRRVEKQRRELSGDFCRGCGYCQPCPEEIEIWQCARMSLLIGRAPYQPFISDEWRREMDKIKNCRNCGLCASRCPYGLDTPALLRRELERYDKLYEELR